MPASPFNDSAVRRRCVAVLAAGALLPPVLAGCTGGEEPAEGKSGAARDIAPDARDRTAAGGSLRWAVDAMPRTLNAFQAEADETTDRIAEAVLPTLFPLDSRARPRLNRDYLESAEVTSREPQQTVVYTLSRKARWSDGKPVTAADFQAQWKALSGRESAFWSARNSGYERVHKVTRGENARQVKVTFARPYSDWKSLFSPLYPRSVMGDPSSFNDSARTRLPVSGGPFRLKGGKVGRKDKTVTLERNPRWWGERARLDTIVLTPVPRAQRAKALAAGRLDLAEIDRTDLRLFERPDSSNKPPAARPEEESAAAASDEASASSGTASDESSSSSSPSSGATGKSEKPDASTSPSASESPKSDASATSEKQSPSAKPSGSADAEDKDEKSAEDTKDTKDTKDEDDDNDKDADEKDEKSDKLTKKERKAAEKARKAAEKAAAARRKAAEERRNLAALTVRRALGPGYTQLALNGTSGPLQDERVRRAIGRALDREKLAESVLKPVGLPAEPLGSHLRGYDQDGYTDSSSAMGDGGREAAAAQLAAAGWQGGPALGTHEAAEEDAKPQGDTSRNAKAASRGLLATLRHGAATAHAGLLRQNAHLDARFAERAEKDEDEAAERLDERAKASMKRADQADRALGRWVGGMLSAEGGLVRAKQGKKLQLRMVVPAGPGAEQLRATSKRIAYMLEEVGIRAELHEVQDEAYFEDHVASGDFDLALYSWPVSAYPVTDARPLFAKPVPAPDGSLLVEQNYTRVGTDQIDSLFEQAVTELDDSARADVLKQIDARVWAVAGSIPLHQRPELVAADRRLVNAGAFGFETPRYQDIGYRK
ncbi:ABC transporter family substrate-binding protein [Streptomyces sp. P38-E01]|uniref:ABC transporter family substrate-binding protein n=1 Tax=Streptomyces tardus TaxID=2780544 RepID=A0A949JGV2_9ACTN|nr:ABC transporter substrate-binding protein [Streptomyces tardus]MBU7599202.1 ABC transporter family substrate-binding protein [Streptomyces tardus]